MNEVPKICGTCRKRDPDTGWCGTWNQTTDSSASCQSWALEEEEEEVDEPAPNSASILLDRSHVVLSPLNEPIAAGCRCPKCRTDNSSNPA